MSKPDHCPTCNALLASDQRYCLNCGTRLTQPRVDFGAALGLQAAPAAAVVRPSGREQRMSLVTVMSGLAAVLLALGVGIVIGRGNGTAAQQKAPVVTVQGAAPAAANATSGSTGAAEPTGAISDEWASGTSAYTVEVSALDKATATAATVAAAKSAATSKGATAVGVLNGDAHSGTPTGKYVIYSGSYATKKLADAAATKLKASFPGALVLHVTPSSSGSSSSSGSGSSNASTSNAGAAAAASLAGKSGNAYSKASAKLPNNIGTGGAPPPKDNKKAGGGTSATCIGC
jgi:hypothetical protein